MLVVISSTVDTNQYWQYRQATLSVVSLEIGCKSGVTFAVVPHGKSYDYILHDEHSQCEGVLENSFLYNDLHYNYK